MKSSIRYLVFLNIISLLFLSLAGVTDGVFSDIFYYLSFLLPVFFLPLLLKKCGGKLLKFHTGAGQIKLLLPLIFPIIAIIFTVSALSSFVFAFFGFESNQELSGTLFEIILKSAVLPALLEELFYRLVIISVLSVYSRRGAAIYSAVLFAFSHCNLFQIPYAFIAGLIFAVLDIAFDSILASVIVHLINNVLSIVFVKYFAGYEIYFAITLLVLALLSLIMILIYRDKYSKLFINAFENDEKPVFSYELLIFLSVTLFVSVTNLF
jgi:membrane protease YdiL (CAAX protease family)